MSVLKMQDEVYRRKAMAENTSDSQPQSTETSRTENLIKSMAKDMIESYPGLINSVARGEKPPSALKAIVKQVIVEGDYVMSGVTDIESLAVKILDSIMGYDKLHPFVEKPNVTDIFVNSSENVWIRENDEDYLIPDVKWASDDELIHYIRAILTRCGAKIHEGKALVDARDLQNNIRINAGIPPVAKTPYLAIRKHTMNHLTSKELIEKGTVTEGVIDFIQKAIEARLNIIIAGPTGSGKTTLMRALAQEYIPQKERIVIAEEEEELMIEHPNQVVLEAKKKGGEEDTEIDMNDLVKNSLRMAMRRIILGELRGKEAFILIRAFGTGHDGGLTTIHSNDTYNTIEQLAVMMLYANTALEYKELERLISQSVDIIVYIEDKMVKEITEVQSFDEEKLKTWLVPIFSTHRKDCGELACEYLGVSEELKKLFWNRKVRVN